MRRAEVARRGGVPASWWRVAVFCKTAYAPAVEAVGPGETRLRSLLDVIAALTGELSLDALLERLVDAAVELTGARYGALGVIDRARSQLERFITTGIDDETRTAIGDPPHGRGILGVLIRDATPLRLHDLSEDP